MIQELNSFFEVTSALYASICVDGKFVTSLWTPKISKAFTFFLSKEKIWDELELNKKISTIINGKINSVYSGFRRIGWMMFIFNIFVLLYSGVWAEYTKTTQASHDYTCELALMGALAISAFFVLQDCRMLVRLIACGVSALLGLIWICISWHFNLGWAKNEYVAVFFALSVVSIPMILALVWKMLVRRYYFIYIEEMLRKEIDHLKKTKSCIERKVQEQESELANLPDEYKDLIITIYVYGERGERDYDLAGIFESRFNKECEMPTIHFLLLYCMKNRSISIELNDSNEEIPTMS